MNDQTTTEQDFAPRTKAEQEAADRAVSMARKDQPARDLLADLSNRERLLMTKAFALGSGNEARLSWHGESRSAPAGSGDTRVLAIVRWVAKALEDGYEP